MLSIVVLISGSGSNLQAIIDGIEKQHLNAEIALVLSNRPQAYGLERAAKASIDTTVIDHKSYPSREAFDAAMAERIDMIKPELIVLAGFMRILSQAFVARYEGKIINIHPALLPDYKGLDTHRRALADGVEYHGASVHFVTPELDSGSVILQGRVPVFADDTETSLQQRVHRIEHIIYPEVVKWFTEGRVGYQQQQAYLDKQPLIHPIIIDQ